MTTRAARGESPAAFGRRCIPAGRVASRSNIPDILTRRALPTGRLTALGATLGFHHGLLGRIGVVVMVGGLLWPAAAQAQMKASVFVSGLIQPVELVQDPSNSARQYVLEQRGVIRVVNNGLLEALDFLDLTLSVSTGGERGLLGLAFPPNYASSGRFFVNFTDTDGNTVVARFRRSAANSLQADPNSRLDLQWPSGQRFIEQPFANHNGGKMLFGPDGFLYIGMGDGGSANDPAHRAQDPTSLLGKMLRIDVTVANTNTKGYRIPPDNPFRDDDPITALKEIWAFGLRNPWRFTVDDPALGGTGALLIADVGQNLFEEIDYEPANTGGQNYGWRNREAAHNRITTRPAAYQPLVDPIHEYGRGFGSSITGGHVYRGSALGTEHAGRYFFADFISGRVASIGLTTDPVTGTVTKSDLQEHTAELGGAAALGRLSSIDVDSQGELYLVDYAGGRILRLEPSVPTITITENGIDPVEVQISVGQQVRFVNNATGTPDISSDPHPVHTQCPAINAVGGLSPGSSRLTGIFTVPASCGFHDHADPSNGALQGTIVVQ